MPSATCSSVSVASGGKSDAAFVLVLAPVNSLVACDADFFTDLLTLHFV